MISAIGPIAGVTETEVSEAIGAIVAVMTDGGPPRLVIASNVVVFSDDELTGEFADVGAEHRRNLAILRDSALDWTALAPELLRDDGATGSFVAKVEAPPPGPTIARERPGARPARCPGPPRLDRARDRDQQLNRAFSAVAPRRC